MGFTLDTVVPWGRNRDEYCRMFGLDADDLRGKILGCGDGPASFNAEVTSGGGTVISVDPLYEFSAEEISGRIDVTFEQVKQQTIQNASEFLWDQMKSPENLCRVRMAAMQAFLADYEAGKEQGRYVTGSLPSLPFSDGAFDLALSSHFLFLYSEHMDLEFHLQAIREMCRVAREARIFPLLQLGATPSPHITPVTETLEGDGYQVQIVEVPYEFQRGGNQMMTVTLPSGD